MLVWSGETNLIQSPLGPELSRMICILIFKTKLHSLTLRIPHYTKALALLSSVSEHVSDVGFCSELGGPLVPRPPMGVHTAAGVIHATSPKLLF